MPVLAAAFCPQPPLLAPELAGTAAPELDGLRAACDEAVRVIEAFGAPVLVLGRAPTARSYDSGAAGTLAPWGADVRAGGDERPVLPLSLTLGAWLLDRAQVGLERRRYASVTDEGDAPDAPEDGPWVLLVMGDGSSTRTPKAPGGLHEGAEGYDRDVVDAFRSGDAEQLAVAAEPGRSRAVGAGGAPAWLAAAQLLTGRPAATARVLSAEAPYGVAYPVAVWTW